MSHIYRYLKQIVTTIESCDLDEQLLWLHQQNNYFQMSSDSQRLLQSEQYVLLTLSQWTEQVNFSQISNEKNIPEHIIAAAWQKAFTIKLFTNLAALELYFNRGIYFKIDDLVLIQSTQGELLGVQLPKTYIAAISSKQLIDLYIDQYLEFFHDFGVGRKHFLTNIENALALAFTKLVRSPMNSSLAEPLILRLSEWISDYKINEPIQIDFNVATKEGKSLIYLSRHICCLKYKGVLKKHCVSCPSIAAEIQYSQMLLKLD
jgi:hypothetical protein